MFSSRILLMPLIVSTPSSSELSLYCHRKSERMDSSTCRSNRCNRQTRKQMMTIGANHIGQDSLNLKNIFWHWMKAFSIQLITVFENQRKSENPNETFWVIFKQCVKWEILVVDMTAGTTTTIRSAPTATCPTSRRCTSCTSIASAWPHWSL